MKPRTLTIGSFFSVAMAATLVGALVTSQVRRPEPAVANTAEGQSRAGAGSVLGLETFRDIARHDQPWRRQHQHQQDGPAAPQPRPVPRLLRTGRRQRALLLPHSRRRARRPRREPHAHEPRLGLRDRRQRLHPDQPARDRGRGRDQRQLPGRQALRREDRRPGRAHRRGADQDRAQGQAHADPSRQLRPGRGRRVGDGGRQPVRALDERRQQRLGGCRVVQGARPGARRSQHVGRDDPDRRRDQPGQLGRAADQHPRRGGRDQHDDRHERHGRERGRWILGADQHRQGHHSPAAGQGEGRARLDGRHDRPDDRRTWPRPTGSTRRRARS